jgi:S-DNA-T family DNA segregation ATPase FtsK/SpoIIIE
MRLGYTRAARIIDTMEQEGLVGPFEGSKPRKILVDREEWLAKNAPESKAIQEVQEQQ